MKTEKDSVDQQLEDAVVECMKRAVKKTGTPVFFVGYEDEDYETVLFTISFMISKADFDRLRSTIVNLIGDLIKPSVERIMEKCKHFNNTSIH